MFSDDRFLRQSEPALDPCDTVAALVPAHSIGATDDDEANVVHTQLADCPQAAAALAHYSQLAELLLFSAPPVAAPPAVAARLRRAITAPALPGAQPILLPRRILGAEASSDGFAADKTKKSSRGWSFSYLTAVAATVLLFALNGTLLVQNRQLQARQNLLANDLVQQNRALILLSAEAPEEVELFDPDGATAAQADILWNTSLGIAVVYVRAFPASQPDQAYQIWLNQGDTKTSAGLFQVDASGMGLLVFPLQQSLDLYDSIGITPEPQTGSPGPTAPPVVRGPV